MIDQMCPLVYKWGMLRVCLVIPGSIFLSDERVFPHLGILRIGAVLEQAGYQVDCLDLSGITNPMDVLESYVLEHKEICTSIVFAVTSTTPQMPQASEILLQLRKITPESRTVLGGPHVTAVFRGSQTEESRGIDGRASKARRDLVHLADILVAGDGEEAIMVALGDKPPTFINGDDRNSPFFLDKEKFSQLPLPARHLIDLNSYHYFIDGKRSGSVIWMQGCPYQCSYCSGRASPSFRLARPRATEDIVNEIALLTREYGYEGIQIYDDEINLVDFQFRKNMEALIELQLKIGKKLRYRGFVKANLLTEAQVKLMKEVGFHEICVGVESAHPRILENINKKATVEDNTRCVELAKKYNLRMKAFCSIGHPGESPESIEALQRWLTKVGVDDFDCTVISPFPSVPYYDEAVRLDSGEYLYTSPRSGDHLRMLDVNYTHENQYFKGDRKLGYVSHVYTDYLSRKEIVEGREWIEETVRSALKLPFYQNKAAQMYDHSYGAIPSHILRSSALAA